MPNNQCGEHGQSPINLPTSTIALGPSVDTFHKTQQDLSEPAVTNPYNKSTNTFAADDVLHGFTSTYGAEYLGAPLEFKAIQFHWHAGSEHTVDGKRMDLEVHTVHYPMDANVENNGQIAAALGVIFDRKNQSDWVTKEQVAIIDAFFDDLFKNQDFVNATPNPHVVSYGKLLQALDTDRRWVQTGSVTTPPCARSVYWNVLRTVQPIKQHHLDNFHIQMNRDAAGNDGYDLRTTGNWRVINKYDTQDLKIVGPAIPMQQIENQLYNGPTWQFVNIIIAVFSILIVLQFVQLIYGNQELDKEIENSKKKQEL